MKITTKIFVLLISGLLCFNITGCFSNQTDNTNNKYYTVFDNSGNIIKDNINSIFAAIDEIGVNGNADWVVVDNSGKEVFRRSTRNNLHMYKKTQFIGSTFNTNEADNFLLNNKQSYVVNGLGTGYYGQSVTRMNSNTTETYGYEYDTGSYIYQFSKPGYQKLKQTVYLSGAKLRLSQNEDIPYNAYFFINTNGIGGACDMGLTSADRHNGKVFLFSFGFGNGFHVHEDLGAITEFTYNETTLEYENADDIYLEYTLDEKGTYLYAKNLTNGVEMRCEELLANSEYKEKYEESWNSRPFLQSTSFVPYLSINGRKLWDPLCGGYLKNVQYSDIQIYKVGETTARDFFPSSEDTFYGFAYADDCSSFSETIFENKKRVVHNVAYDGTINN